MIPQPFLDTDQLDKILPSKIARAGKQLFADGLVFDLEPVSSDSGIMFAALVEDNGDAYLAQASINLESKQLSGSCDCNLGIICAHSAAILYALATISESATLTQEERLKQITEQNLATLKTTQLRKIAKRHGWKLKGTRKADLAEQVAQHLNKSWEDGLFLTGLSPQQRELLAAIHLIFDINKGFPIEFADEAYRKFLKHKGNTRKLIDALIEYGVLFQDNGYYDDIFMPIRLISSSEIGVAVLGIKPLPQKRFPGTTQLSLDMPLSAALQQIGEQIVAAGGVKAADEEWQQAKNVVIFLNAAGGTVWPMAQADVTDSDQFMGFGTTERQIPVQVQRRLLRDKSAEMLTTITNSRDKAEWLWDMLYQLQLIYEDEQGERQFQLDLAGWENYMQLPPDELALTLFSLWQTRHSDLYPLRKLLRDHAEWQPWRVSNLGFGYDLFLKHFQFGTHTLLRFLSQLSLSRTTPSSNWFDVQALLKQIERWTPELFHGSLQPDLWGFTRRGTVIPLKSPQFWKQSYGAMVINLLTGPLYWMGMVELLERDGKPVALRLTSLGRWLLHPVGELGAMPESDSAESSTVIWQTAKTVSLSIGNNYNALLAITNRYMQPLRGKTGWYALDGGKLERAFEAGETPAQILAALGELGGEISAENASAQVDHITTLHSRYGLVHVYEKLTVMQFADDFALAELRAARLIDSAAIIHEYSPRLIIIHDAAVDRLVKAMQKKGYTPRVEQ